MSAKLWRIIDNHNDTIEKQGRLIDEKNGRIDTLESENLTLKTRVLRLEAELEYAREQMRIINMSANGIKR